jgi:hypothetical protein
MRRNNRADRPRTGGHMEKMGASKGELHMPTLHARTVRRAAEIAGAVEALAAQLNVRDELLRKCMEGELPVPEALFLQCVDIVNADQLRQIGSLDSEKPH